ncbi:MAG TPA: family 16 glycoside hydrolase [Planctomycetaceae bacterium]|jgi:type 1 glutamine amidotransferase|nr:family 16 glycoside hydrolase [Planctomycetaceae bacterium]
MPCRPNSRLSPPSALLALAIVLSICLALPHRASSAEPDSPSLFDGQTLQGWTGNPEFWHVEDGTITGETTAEHPTRGNTFLIKEGFNTKDFEFSVEYKIRSGRTPGKGFQPNSGVQYRSWEMPGKRWVCAGYQADIDAGDTYSGSIYGENFRGLLAVRGQKTVIESNHKPRIVGSVGDPKELQTHIKKDDWNTYQITVRGFHFEQRINGVLMAVCDDDDKEMRRSDGILALQLHAGPPMKVQFRNLKYKELKPEGSTSTSEQNRQHQKKIVFIAGKRSHGYAEHEHRAGCLLLAKALNENVPDIHAVVVENGWPKDPSILDDADCVVVYADGGGGHPLVKHLDEFDKLMKRGVGLVCLHYAVEVPNGRPGEEMEQWTGGYFAPDWSVNPHWTASYKSLPQHAVTRGVHPFTINDEWYYHMRFLPQGNVTPILTDLPPQSTLSRPDGTHSGNPAVREAIAKGEPQTMAWARERPDGGRGFGLSGGHVHWNWGNDNFRKLVLNAIVWAAHGDVPANGIGSRPLSVKDLEANQDKPQPPDFNPARIQALLDQWRAESGS